LIPPAWSATPSQCFHEHRTGSADEPHEGRYRNLLQYRQNSGLPLVSPRVWIFGVDALSARRSGKRCSCRRTSFYSREHVDKFEEHWHGAGGFNFHFLGTRIRGYDAVQFRTCRRDANKDHARATKRMCAHGTCGKRGHARIDPKMKHTNAEPKRERVDIGLPPIQARAQASAASADYTQ